MTGSFDKLRMFDPINIFSTKFKTSQKDRQAIILEHDNCWKSVWTISLPISYVKTRFTFPALALNATISLLPFLETPNQIIKKVKDDMYDINNFGRMNLLAGLCE
ncbi:20443_t:CDS:2, partial [Dentiscutata erythropus]